MYIFNQIPIKYKMNAFILKMQHVLLFFRHGDDPKLSAHTQDQHVSILWLQQQRQQ